MKITKNTLSVFMLTFILGCACAIFLNFCQTEVKNISVSEVELSSPTKIELQTIAPVEAKKDDFEPKMFKVADFWDESLNQENKHFIETGEVSNGENFKFKSGDIWFGLFGENKIKQTKIRVKRSVDEDLNWTEISAKANEKPLFLVKKLKNVKEGKVRTLFRGLTWEEVRDTEKQQTTLKKGFSENFKLGSKQYTLRVEEGIDENQNKILVLLLETGSKSQMIHYIDYMGEGDYVGNLFWVGDMDSDGKLDLFMDFWNYEKGYYSSGLFLSSEAKNGKLVKRFEYLAFSGC